MPKAQAVARFATQANPYLRAEYTVMSAGNTVTPRPDLLDSATHLTDLFRNADLVIDATADPSVQQYTSEVARETKTTWVCADATPGIGGGTVVKVDAESDACYACFLWRQWLSKDDPEHIPSAPTCADPGVQPVGCGERTFTGSGFDLEVVSVQAARVAVAALLAHLEGGYPSDGMDVHLLTLRDPEGHPVPPVWQGLVLTRYAACTNH